MTTTKQELAAYIERLEGTKEGVVLKSLYGSLTAFTAIIQQYDKVFNALPQDIVSAAMQGAAQGLTADPVLGHGYISTENKKVGNGWVTGAKFVPGYRGYLHLAYATGEFRGMPSAALVYEKDKFQPVYGFEKNIIHEADPFSNRGKIIGAYCCWTFKDGSRGFEPMSKEEIDKIMKRSKSKDKDGAIVGPWVTDYEQMALKTVVRRSSKYWPLKSEQRAVLIGDEADYEEPVVEAPQAQKQPEYKKEKVDELADHMEQMSNDDLLAPVTPVAEPVAPIPATKDQHTEEDVQEAVDLIEWCEKQSKLLETFTVKSQAEKWTAENKVKLRELKMENIDLHKQMQKSYADIIGKFTD